VGPDLSAFAAACDRWDRWDLVSGPFDDQIVALFIDWHRAKLCALALASNTRCRRRVLHHHEAQALSAQDNVVRIPQAGVPHSVNIFLPEEDIVALLQVMDLCIRHQQFLLVGRGFPRLVFYEKPQPLIFLRQPLILLLQAAITSRPLSLAPRVCT
jgi:hypothetical protein